MKSIEVMIVDDSAVVRQVLRSVLEGDPGIRVIATAADPLFAQQHLQRQWPDVIVLDVEMPRMDGLSFLRWLMQTRPTPVVICSSLTGPAARTGCEALAAGAVAIVTKPVIGLRDFLLGNAAELIQAVRAAAQSKLAAVPQRPPPLAGTALAETSERVVAIGTSTGGVQALEVVLTALPAVCPGLVVVQHMPAQFTAAFARRLDSLCRIDVREAADGDRVLPGLALIAPGGRHLRLRRSGAQYLVEVVDGPLVSRHRPSVDVLFRSVAQAAGANALGIIMTGMGDDGARGMVELHDSGALCLAQDEASCVVYGMPAEAVRRGAVDIVLPLAALAGRIVEQPWRR